MGGYLIGAAPHLKLVLSRYCCFDSISRRVRPPCTGCMFRLQPLNCEHHSNEGRVDERRGGQEDKLSGGNTVEYPSAHISADPSRMGDSSEVLYRIAKTLRPLRWDGVPDLQGLLCCCAYKCPTCIVHNCFQQLQVVAIGAAAAAASQSCCCMVAAGAIHYWPNHEVTCCAAMHGLGGHVSGASPRVKPYIPSRR
jgi:hypothetical protein